MRVHCPLPELIRHATAGKLTFKGSVIGPALKGENGSAKILWAAIPSGSSGAFIDRLVVTSQGGIYAGGSTAHRAAVA